jgi:hypothetical protein
MIENDLRESLSGRLDAIDLECDIKTLIAQLNYHKSKTKVFDETIQFQQDKLDDLVGIPKISSEQGEIYK